jgi:MtrB/PioB family decaheme-associated outer membrane protein
MHKKLRALLIANVILAAPAFAQSDEFAVHGSVSLGGMHVDDGDARDASKLNEYRDLSSGLMSGFDLKGRGNRWWLDAFGENLGRDDQYLTLRGGQYDLFKFRLYSDALKHNFLFDGITPYAGAGSTTNTATFPRLDTSTWNSLDVGYKRRDNGGYFEFQGLAPWYFRADANQVTSSGTKLGANAQGTSPTNGFVDLAFPVEYRTRNATFEAGYNTKTIHAALAWMTSRFDDANESFTWTNGYFGNATDRTYLPPDNKYSRLAGNATFRQLPMSSTLALRFTKDELKSDAGLATSVLNTTAGAFAATGPNAGSFSGNVKNETFTVTLASSPVKNLDTRIYSNYYKREDNSTHVEFDSAIGVFDNEPSSYKKNNYGVDAFFRVNRQNRLGAGWDYLDTKRERFDFDRTKDNKYFVEWKNSSLDSLAARLKYTRLDRRSDFLLANDGANANDVLFWNRFLKAFDAADLDQDQVKLTLDFSPMDFLDISFEGITKKNKYRDQILGRLKDDRHEAYVSASYGDPSGPRFTVFGDIENVKYESRHRVVGTATAPGAYDPATPATAANYNWEGSSKDRNWAFGVALDWPVSDKLMVKASAMYYKTDGSVDFASQTSVTSPTYPQPIAAYDDSKRTSLSIRGVYNHNKSWTFTAGYAFEKFDYRDAQYDGYQYTIPAATGQNSYLNGYYANPQYKANIVYGLASYRF